MPIAISEKSDPFVIAGEIRQRLNGNNPHENIFGDNPETQKITYRKLMLLLHPDKHRNRSDEDLNILEDITKNLTLLFSEKEKFKISEKANFQREPREAAASAIPGFLNVFVVSLSAAGLSKDRDLKDYVEKIKKSWDFLAKINQKNPGIDTVTGLNPPVIFYSLEAAKEYAAKSTPERFTIAQIHVTEDYSEKDPFSDITIGNVACIYNGRGGIVHSSEAFNTARGGTCQEALMEKSKALLLNMKVPLSDVEKAIEAYDKEKGALRRAFHSQAKEVASLNVLAVKAKREGRTEVSIGEITSAYQNDPEVTALLTTGEEAASTSDRKARMDVIVTIANTPALKQQQEALRAQPLAITQGPGISNK